MGRPVVTFSQILGLFMLSSLWAESALADTSTALPRLPRELGVVEQTIAVSFKPVSVYALVESSSARQIKQYRASALPTAAGVTSVEAGQTVVVGAAIPIDSTAPADEVFHYTFFLASLDGQFAATEVRSLTWKALQENSLTAESLEQETVRLESELPAYRERNLELESRLADLREKLAKIAGVDDIIDMRSELENLKGFDEKKTGELERLKLLARAALQSPEPTDADNKRLDLSEQLKVAAGITADADRLGAGKKQSAEAEYNRKVELVQQKGNLDSQALAQQLLALRKRRKELEARVSVDAVPEDESARDF